MIPRLELRNICKRYPGVVANDDISLAIMPGEIHAVLGENGAGKSTLMKIIYGAVQADSGEILCDGKPIAVPQPRRFAGARHRDGLPALRAVRIRLGGREHRAFDEHALRPRSAVAAGLELSGTYGMPIDPARLVHDLSVGERQRVEIVRCLLQDPKLLILDEPTSVLTPQAVVKLFETLRQLAAEGCSILYISHKLDEVQQLCDTRDRAAQRPGDRHGSAQADRLGRAGAHDGRLAACRKCMSSPSVPQRASRCWKSAACRAAAADRYGVDLDDISFDVFGGEIVGIAGVSGNGQAELVALLSGETLHRDGEAIRIAGSAAGHLDPDRPPRPRHGLRAGGAARPRRRAVAFADARTPCSPDIASGRCGSGLVDRGAPRAFARGIIETLQRQGQWRARQGAEPVRRQPAEVHRRPRDRAASRSCSLVSQPTWGVDVGAAAFIRQTLVDLSRAGAAVLIVSEELDELFEICDRLLVICQWRASRARWCAAAPNREEVGLLMTGRNSGSAANGGGGVALQD